MAGLKLPKTSPPMQIELEYSKKLLQMVRFLQQEIKEKVIPMLKPLVAMNAASLPTPPRRDSEHMDDRKVIDDLFLNLANSAEEAYPVQWAEGVAADAGRSVERFNTTQSKTTYARLLGVRPILAEPWLEQKAAAFVADNVDLISSIRTQYHQRVRGMVTRAVDRGTLNRDFADRIESVFREELEAATSSVRARARLIARDQVAKLNSQINQARQQSMGFTHYRWRTSGDERVRASHEEKNGKVFAWDDPPSDTGHPGEDYQCRCYAEPIITEDFEGDTALAGSFNSRR